MSESTSKFEAKAIPRDSSYYAGRSKQILQPSSVHIRTGHNQQPFSKESKLQIRIIPDSSFRSESHPARLLTSHRPLQKKHVSLIRSHSNEAQSKECPRQGNQNSKDESTRTLQIALATMFKMTRFSLCIRNFHHTGNCAAMVTALPH